MIETMESYDRLRFDWIDVIGRARLGELIPAGKNVDKSGAPTKGRITATTVKAIALLFAGHADPDGSRVFPGDATIAVLAECSIKTVTAVRKALLSVGLMRMEAQRRARGVREYRLTIPVDVHGVLGVLSPAQVKLRAEAVRVARKGKPAGSADHPHQGGPAEPPMEVSADRPGGSGGTPENPIGGSGGTAQGGPPDPLTSHDQPPRSTSQQKRDLSTAVAVRARGVIIPKERVRSIVVKCDHGLPIRLRPDGLRTCRFCRDVIADPRAA